MNVAQIRQVGKGVRGYLAEFADCFGRCDTRAYLEVYVRGQTSNLQRKSVERMALRAKVPPRSLQAYLEFLSWDEQRMVDRLQEIVVRDHSDPHAIGTVDETGIPKKGDHTAGVQHQWCGRTGKVDHCVVSVHLGYAVGDFHCLLDSDVFLPERWANDPKRRQKAHIPDEVRYRSKPQIAMDQIRRALANGVRVASWTFDENYGNCYWFLDELDRMGQTYVAEVPRDFYGWALYPKIIHRPPPQLAHRGGRKGRFPRLAKTARRPSKVEDLLRHSRAFTSQPWTPIHIKDGEKGPLVREVKAIAFYMQRSGLPTRPHWLIAARNPEEPQVIKFFVSNADPGVPLEWVVYVAYSRWPIERCFQEDKDRLGLDHFEVRGWGTIHRHMYLTQLSHLYLSRTRLRLRAQEKQEQQDGVFSLPSPRGRSAWVFGREPDPLPDSRRPGGVPGGLAVG